MVLLATFLVAGSFIVSKKLSGVIHPISLNLLRFLIAAFILAPSVLLDAKRRALIFHTWGRALIISFFYTFYFILFFQALEHTTALSTGTLYTLFFQRAHQPNATVHLRMWHHRYIDCRL